MAYVGAEAAAALGGMDIRGREGSGQLHELGPERLPLVVLATAAAPNTPYAPPYTHQHTQSNIQKNVPAALPSLASRSFFFRSSSALIASMAGAGAWCGGCGCLCRGWGRLER